MPFISGKFYANPAFGRGVEAARLVELSSQQGAPSQPVTAGQQEKHDEGTRWVTIDGRHVLIRDGQAQRQPHVSARDKAYLDKYYDAVASLAKRYNVDPALVLGVGIESGFASQGTYLRTGDAFGMTGGSTKHMTAAESPEQNVKQFFDNYGNQIRGTGSDATAFVNGLQGRDASGNPVNGWKVYNTDRPASWGVLVNQGIAQMRRSAPAYLAQRTKEHAH